jgi:hypothetical protein
MRSKTVRVLLMFLLLESLPAAWAAEPVYAVHPLNVVEAKDEAETNRFQELLPEKLSELHVAMAEKECVTGFLAKLPEKTCAGEEECLGRLGHACGTQRALFVSIAPNRPNGAVRVSGLMVRADGLAGTNSMEIEFPRSGKKGHDAQVGEALRAFLTRLMRMDFAPTSVSLVAPPPSPSPSNQTTVSAVARTGPEAGRTVTAAGMESGGGKNSRTSGDVGFSSDPGAGSGPTPVAHDNSLVAEVARPGSGLRRAGVVVAGVGVAALAASAVTALVAQGDRSTLKGLLDANGNAPSTPQATGLQSSLKTASTVTTATLISGATLAVAGTMMFLVGLHQGSFGVGAAPQPGGGTVVLSGGF